MKHLILMVSSAIAIALLIAGCGYFQVGEARSPSKTMGKEIEEIVTQIYQNRQFTGSVLVSVKGEIVFKKGFGYASIEDSIPNTCDTKFRIASFTKPFTVMLILQLVEDGKLELDGKLTDYLPEFPEEKGKDITIHQLLSHTAGITGEWRIPNLIDIEKEYYTRERLLNCIIARDLVFEPGEGREYSNFGYALLGLIIERVSGKSYDELLLEKICVPAGMKNTLSDVNALPIANRATGYVYDYFDGIGVYSFIDMSFALGSGQLLSTVEDLYLFDQALYTDKLLTGKSKELFFNEYGWLDYSYPVGNGFKKVLSKNLDGSVNGFQSHTQRIEKDGVFIVTLRNIKESVYENQIVIKWPQWMVARILAVIYAEDYDLPQKSGAYFVFKALLESGLSEAESLHESIQQKQTEDYYLNKREFRFFTDLLTERGMTVQAAQYKSIHENQPVK
jgi:CubicO group peptidase (beta-lactamase class C family)